MTPEAFGLSVPKGWTWQVTRHGLSFAHATSTVVVNVVASDDHRRASGSIVAWLPADQPRGDFFRLDGREVPAAQVAGEIRRLADRAAKMGFLVLGDWLSIESK
jgi:hypothetical protein